MRQAHEPLRFLEQRFVGLPVGRDDPVTDGLEVALQVGQRGAQLMRGVGDDVAPLALALLEGGGHLVEGVGQAGQLVRRRAWHARGEVPAGHAPRRGAHFRQRPGDHAAEGDGQRHAGRDGNADGDQQHVADGLVEHDVGVLSGVPGLHGQVGQGLAAHHPHTDGHDGHRDEGGGDAHERDAPGQPSSEGQPSMALARLAHASRGAGAARYPTPRTVMT